MKVTATVLALGALAPFVAGFTPMSFRTGLTRASGLRKMAEEPAAVAPAAEGEAETEAEAEAVVEEPAPVLSSKSQSLPFLPRPEALDGTMVGDVGFDPLGLSTAFSVKWMREAELKHGRISMLAVLGFIATDIGIRLPGEVHQVSSVAAHDVAVKSGAMFQMLIWIGLAELWGAVAIKEMLAGETDRQPGDFYLDVSGGYGRMSPEEKEKMQLKELKNGRLAMLAIGGILTQAALTGKGFPYA